MQLPKLTKEEVEALIKAIRECETSDEYSEDEEDYCCTSDAFDGGFISAIRAIRKLYKDVL